ncbi:hypothetical protein Afil01_56170 [Actinorhabdospora filicis]|uniref:Uncharacterized protein n=1 Tax=Actinorhabdospora filicis TaxID=1785913 RepID=A0A9W6WDG4_9ACTN|nr:hypothetical protein [Actinorhabdospora filicis]GLZ80810.1 hypothetical protein Afil01_56170 [Actinorhabdospora filicis]
MQTRPRLGAITLAASGLLFLAYPALRPDETKMDPATAMASNQWILAHLLGVFAFILAGLGVAAVRDRVRETRGAEAGRWAMITTWIGAGMTLPYYGAEIFGVHEMASRAIADNNPALLDMVDSFRYHPAAVTTFAIGLALLGAGGVLTAIAIGRSKLTGAWTGVVFAIGLALYIPQYFTPMPVRIAHGAIIAIGAAWVAVAMWRGAKK